MRDLDGLSALTQLEELRIYTSGSGVSLLEDLGGLRNMSDMKDLSLYVGSVKDFSPLSGMTKMTDLQLTGDFYFTDLSFLSNMTELRELYINGSSESTLKDYTDLQDLTKLQTLHISASGMSSLKGLENMSELRDARLSGNAGIGATYSDTEPLRNLTKLQSLYLPPRGYDTETYCDLSGLSGMTSLQELDLSGKIQSLEPLAGLTSLKTLDINDQSDDTSPVLDLRPLASLKSVTDLNLFHTSRRRRSDGHRTNDGAADGISEHRPVQQPCAGPVAPGKSDESDEPDDLQHSRRHRYLAGGPCAQCLCELKEGSEWRGKRPASATNCFREKPDASGPCPYCGFDLAENERKYPVALRAGTVLNGPLHRGPRSRPGRLRHHVSCLGHQAGGPGGREGVHAKRDRHPCGHHGLRGGGEPDGGLHLRRRAVPGGARTLAKFMGQPNIAGVTDYFDENDTSYFVMDYIEGISFKTYIANHGGKVSVDDALNVMIPVLRALTAVHAEGFIHRDVTPDNIYITKDGQVKLLDFGSARYSIGGQVQEPGCHPEGGLCPEGAVHPPEPTGSLHRRVLLRRLLLRPPSTGYLPPESLERLEPRRAGARVPVRH